MPPLTKRNAPRLLRNIHGKPHASDDDHETNGTPTTKTGFQLPTPASSINTPSATFKTFDDIDIYADPISSDDDRNKGFKLPEAPTPPAKEEAMSGFKPPPQVDGPHEPRKGPKAEFERPSRSSGKQEIPPSPKFRKPPGEASPASSGSKRKLEDWELDSDDEDGVIFSSQVTQKKRPRVAPVPNLFVSKTTKAKGVGYGQKAQRQKSREDGLKKAEEAKLTKAAEAEKAKGPVFKHVAISTSFADTESVFKTPGKSLDMDIAFQACDPGGEDYNADSPSLSSLSTPHSSPPPEVIASFNLPSAIRKMECAICCSQVPASWREDYEDQYPDAKVWNYKWQQRFCRYHKQSQARQLWDERGYPEINWVRLEARLAQRKHMKHVERVISGEVTSAFRKGFQSKVKSRAKTLLQAANDENVGKGASAGYYGPRGEKMMTDHILISLADSLRSHATKDSLVAASGVSGGVSGFVQSVLVPELTVSLIREDLGAKSTRNPVEVLEESAELGEVLCPELEDHLRSLEGGSDGMEE